MIFVRLKKKETDKNVIGINWPGIKKKKSPGRYLIGVNIDKNNSLKGGLVFGENVIQLSCRSALEQGSKGDSKNK